jgi:hypothetical protein
MPGCLSLHPEGAAGTVSGHVSEWDDPGLSEGAHLARKLGSADSVTSE